MKFFAVIFVALCVGVVMANGQVGVAHITGTRVNLRKGPGTHYGIIRQLNRPEAYRVLEEQGRWLRLGTDQWVFNDPSFLRFERSGGGSSTASGNYNGYRDLDLKLNAGLTAGQIDDWINSKTRNKPDSVMRGKGAVFVRAAQESGLNVRYLVAHAAEETGWGTSRIARTKGNMYGIGAFDRSPMRSAYNYNTVDTGIVEGAKWIATNYVNRGQNTLRKMRWNNGVHEYATNRDWDTNIAKIMASGPH